MVKLADAFISSMGDEIRREFDHLLRPGAI